MLHAGWNVETRLIASPIGKVIRVKEEAAILVEVIWGGIVETRFIATIWQRFIARLNYTR
jgi:hypothetical protein